ncbi:hypothetical protein D9M70_23040 [compost metagenome]
MQRTYRCEPADSAPSTWITGSDGATGGGNGAEVDLFGREWALHRPEMEKARCQWFFGNAGQQ